jgi:histidinol-phosphate/aromatic aminotransferase/cobyric acid decarboxylase-like protein
MPPPPRPLIKPASKQDRHAIYAIRHQVYATELHQHQPIATQLLTDDLDKVNHYIVALSGEEVCGFISITPPASTHFSVDKYFSRSSIPYPFDEYLYEIRLLTVLKENRSGPIALTLMYAAFRWIQSHGGRYVVAIGRAELMGMYTKVGLRGLNQQVQSGAIIYQLCVANIDELQAEVQNRLGLYGSLQGRVEWQLPFSFFAPSACYHGGSFFRAIGEDLQTLHKANEIINADVLDAWFPPSPAVLALLHKHLAWLLQTSPPTHAGGLIHTIARVRGLKESSILPGAGSSDLIFLGLRTLLAKTARVLLLDPSYGEYAHVLEQVIGCRVHRFTVYRQEGFRINTAALLEEIQNGYDLVVLVNPNSPTGIYLPGKDMEALLSQVPSSTLVWIDETYIDYVASAESVERFAGSAENIIVCKSMSKVYALSGVRAAYLCGSPHLLETLKSLTPPWAVSLPAQAAAIAALNDPSYYQEQYTQTHALRARLKQALLALGITDIVDGVANFLLIYLPDHVQKDPFLAACQRYGLYLRDASSMGKPLGPKAIRIAVKDDATMRKMVSILEKVLRMER